MAAIVILGALVLALAATGSRAQQTGSLNTSQVETLLLETAEKWARRYEDVLTTPTSLASCSAAIPRDFPVCQTRSRGVFANRAGGYLADPSEFASLCTSFTFDDVWQEISDNFTGIVDSLYFIDAYGSYFSGFYGNGGGGGGGLCENFDANNYDPRVNLQFIETVSSPKVITILNLASQAPPPDPSDTHLRQAIDYIIDETLSEVDYLALLSPTVDSFTDGSYVVKATPENLNPIKIDLDSAFAANQTGNGTLDWLNTTLLEELLRKDATIFNETVCFEALIVFLAGDIPSQVADAIRAGFAVNSDLRVFLFSIHPLAGGQRSEFTEVDRLLCETKAVFHNSTAFGAVGQRDTHNYLHYFLTSSYGDMVTWVTDRAPLTNDTLSACLPLFDSNQATVSSSGVLLGTLCLDLRPDRISDRKATRVCLPDTTELFDFVFLRYAYRTSDTALTHCDNIELSQAYDGELYLNLIGEFLDASTEAGRFAQELIESDLISDACPAALTSPLLACEEGSSFVADVNFNQPVSVEQSVLFWPPRLNQVLGNADVSSAPRENQLSLWQRVCASAYYDILWRAVFNSNPPISFEYGEYQDGFTRAFPGYLPPDDICNDLDRADPRLQPWFAPTVSGPKVVIVITDVAYGFLDDLQSLSVGLRAVLNSLNQDDLLELFPTNSARGVFQQVVRATTSNLAAARDFVASADYSTANRDPNAAIQRAIAALNTSCRGSTERNCALLVLTDNAFLDPLAQTFSSRLHGFMDFLKTNDIRVFTSLFSAYQEGTLLKNISCETGGIYDRLHDLSETQTALRTAQYYFMYAGVEQPEGTRVWFDYFTEELTGLNSTRVCAPTYHYSLDDVPIATLLGASCITLPVGNLTANQLEALDERINESNRSAMPLNFTFEQANQFRGLHQCDLFNTTSAESFRFRIENTIRVYRSEAESALTILRRLPASSNCPFGDIIFDSCSSQPPPASLANNTRYNCAISTQGTSVYTRQFLGGFLPLVGYSINTIRQFNPDAFERLCVSEALDDLWTSGDVAQETGLLWSFYGDAATQTLRYFPYSSGCGLNSPQECEARDYNPLFRPWYTSAVTAPKILYLLIHVTQSSNFPSMQSAAMAVINTLTHRDFIQIQFATSRLQSRLLPASSFIASDSATRTQAMNLLSNSEYAPGSNNLTETFNGVFQLFSDVLDGNSSGVRGCHRILIFFTDSELDGALPQEIQLSQSSLGTSVDIFTFSFGGLFANPRIPQQIACENRGEWFEVSSNDASQIVNSYYSLYSASVQRSSVVWSEPFTDVLSGRDVVSACLPVYDPATTENRTAALLGVTCTLIDITRFDDFPDGQLVLQAVIDRQAVFCPIVELTEAERDDLRQTKCQAPSISSAQDLALSLQQSVRDAADLHSQALAAVFGITEQDFQCPFQPFLFDSCDLTASDRQQFAPDGNYSALVNISFSGLGVIINPEDEGLLHNGTISLNQLTSTQPLFALLCPALIEERVWQVTRGNSPQTNLQFFASDYGFLLTDPAVQLSDDFCRSEMYDPRLRPYYAAAASGFKDVVVVIDAIETFNSFSSSVLSQAAVDILQTFSSLDYFNIIAGSTNFSRTLTPGGLNENADASSFLSVLEYVGNDQVSQVTGAFEMLSQARRTGATSNCQSAIVILTDRDISQATVDAVTAMSAEFQSSFGSDVKVSVTTVANRPQGQRALDLVCNNTGVWNIILPSEFDNARVIREKAIGYYRVLAKAVSFFDPIWSELYDDVFGLGLVATLCIPVYDNSINIGQLLGLSCTDVPETVFQSFPDGSVLLERLLEEQRSNADICAVGRLTMAQADVVRPEGFRCLSPPTPPTSSPATAQPSEATTTLTLPTSSPATTQPSEATTPLTLPTSSPATTQPSEATITPSGTTTPTQPSEATSGTTTPRRRNVAGLVVGIIFGITGALIFLVLLTVSLLIVCRKLQSGRRKRYIPASNETQLTDKLLEDDEAVPLDL